MDDEPDFRSASEPQLEIFLGVVARHLIHNGKAAAAAVVTLGSPTLEWREAWNDEMERTYDHYTLRFEIEEEFYRQIYPNLYTIERDIDKAARPYREAYPCSELHEMKIVPRLVQDTQWRDKASKLLFGKGVTNQGRVRSDNVAPYKYRGLLFRSKAEINLFEALIGYQIPVAPLPAFVKGGDQPRRVEPDFAILSDGLLFIIEVDGKEFHKESPVEAQERLRMLDREGAHILRVAAGECATPEMARRVVSNLINEMRKYKQSKG
jgi:hypothetical protein